ncbi:MAG: hypothetical protein AB8B63_24820, partial [Granulosicoccus sp.]
MAYHPVPLRKATCALVLGASALLLSSCGRNIDSEESAQTQIAELVQKKIDPTFVENTVRANIQLTQTNLLSMLPELNELPMTVRARDDRQTEVVEIFTSSEKAGSGRDGFYNALADAFNARGIKLSNGKRAAVAIRKVASGLGAQFILSGRYVPDGFSPSNELWGQMITAAGIPLETMATVTAPNTAGIVVKKSRMDLITSGGELDFAKLLTNVSSGSF